MILCSWSTLRSGWAAAIPSSASLTTSAGSLMSFFIWVLLLSGLHGLACRLHRGGGGGRAVGGRAGHGDEGECGDHAGQQLGDHVDGELLPLHAAAGDLLN